MAIVYAKNSGVKARGRKKVTLMFSHKVKTIGVKIQLGKRFAGHASGAGGG